MLSDQKERYLAIMSKDIPPNVKAKHESTVSAIQNILDGAGDKHIRSNLSNCELYGLYFHDGKYQTLNKWSSDLGIPYTTLYKRIFKYGFAFDDAIIKMSSHDAYKTLSNSLPAGYVRKHSDAFLEKHEKAMAVKAKEKEQKLMKKAEAEQRLEELLFEFNKLGWADFIKKYGEKQGRIMFSRLKHKFGKKCVTTRKN